MWPLKVRRTFVRAYAPRLGLAHALKACPDADPVAFAAEYAALIGDRERLREAEAQALSRREFDFQLRGGRHRRRSHEASTASTGLPAGPAFSKQRRSLNRQQPPGDRYGGQREPQIAWHLREFRRVGCQDSAFDRSATRYCNQVPQHDRSIQRSVERHRLAWPKRWRLARSVVPLQWSLSGPAVSAKPSESCRFHRRWPGRAFAALRGRRRQPVGQNGGHRHPERAPTPKSPGSWPCAAAQSTSSYWICCPTSRKADTILITWRMNDLEAGIQWRACIFCLGMGHHVKECPHDHKHRGGLR